MKASRKENITLTELLYAVITRFGKDGSITVRAAHEIELPKRAAVLANPVGTDLDITVMVDDEVDLYLAAKEKLDASTE